MSDASVGRREQSGRSRAHSRLGIALLALCMGSVSLAAGRAIEDIRFMKQSGLATADIVFSCPVRYLDHAPATGVAVRVRLALEPECLTTIGRGLRSELYDPPGGDLAGINEVVFDTEEGRIATIAINLAAVARFEVSQGRTRDVIHVALESVFDDAAAQEPPRAVAPEPAPSRAVVPGARPPLAASPGVATPPAAERPPLRLVQRPVPRGERFVIRLTAAATVDTAGAASIGERGETLYLSDFAAGSRRWQELRLGFFDTEQSAGERLAGLRPAFRQATIAVADVLEQDRAAATRLAPNLPQAAGSAAAEAAPATPAAPSLAQERIVALLAEANEAMLAADYDRGIQIYSRLLEEPAFAARREARERLGIARERKGQVAQAKSEYDAYLAEFPDGPDAQRVRQRLAGLAAGAEPRVQRLETPPAEAGTWEFSGGAAQYFRRDVLQPLDDRPDTTEQSVLISNLDMTVRRHGERFELMSRVNAAYHYNLLDETETADPGDQLYVANAYVDLMDLDRDWSARVGRQSMYAAGVLGRFDGAHASYRWRPDVAFNVTLGRPVDFPRRTIDTHRQFVGFSADMDALVARWDFTFFAIMQEIDGIADRQAVGAEARYRGENLSVVGVVDADSSYGVLNSALVTANWRATDKLTLNGRVNIGAAPFLTTRNALIGQAAATLEDMLKTYSEDQVRRLARDRTAQVSTGTIGLSRPLFDRYRLSFDVGYYEVDATIGSGGVAEVPASDAQTFFYASLVGSSVVKDGDTAIFSLQHSDTRSGTSDTLLFDFRFPTAARLRLNPRLALSSRRHAGDDSEEWIAAPMLRLAFRWPRQHQFELELGARLSTRDFAAVEAAGFEPRQESSEYFCNVGYWWEF